MCWFAITESAHAYRRHSWVYAYPSAFGTTGIQRIFAKIGMSPAAGMSRTAGGANKPGFPGELADPDRAGRHSARSGSARKLQRTQCCSGLNVAAGAMRGGSDRDLRFLGGSCGPSQGGLTRLAYPGIFPSASSCSHSSMSGQSVAHVPKSAMWQYPSSRAMVLSRS